MIECCFYILLLILFKSIITCSQQFIPYSNLNIKNSLINKNAILEVRQTITKEKEDIVSLLIQGFYLNIGPKTNADGDLICLPSTLCGSNDLIINYKQWIGLIHDTNHESNNSENSQCISLLERVKKAVIFGASAIIILSLNPNILKELDGMHHSRIPLILVKDIDNITVLLNAVKSKMKLKLRIIFGKSLYDIQTFTIWSACWRAKPGSGVVCHSDNKKIDSGISWNYIYSFLVILILLLILKSNNRQVSDESDEQSSSSVTQLALSLLKTKRYRKVIYNHDDKDTCAICLDTFHFRQKLRVLPCTHEFHTRCVDQWLCINNTCPLCKQNIKFLTEN